MNNKQIVIADKPLNLDLVQFGGAVNDKWTLTGVRQFVADKAGIVIPKPAKGEKGLSYAEVKTLATDAGFSKDEIKAWGKEYDSLRANFKTVGKQMTAMCVADPRVSMVARPVFGKHGFIGINTKARIDRSPNGATKVATLEAKIVALEARLALQNG